MSKKRASIKNLIAGVYGKEFGIENLNEVTRLLYVKTDNIAQKLSKAATNNPVALIEDLIDLIKATAFNLSASELKKLLEIDLPLAERLYRGDRTVKKEELLAHGRDRENWDWLGSAIGILISIAAMPSIQHC